MKYTYLHINSTQQELHVDVCEKNWTYTAENPQLTLSDPGYFRQLTIRGGGALKAPPMI